MRRGVGRGQYRGGGLRAMKKLLLLSLLVSAASAQVALPDLANLATALTAKLTPEASITGTSGSLCGLWKVASPTISMYWKCTSADGKNVQGPVPIAAQSPTIVPQLLMYNEVLMLLVVNPTSTAAPSGTMLGAPAVGVAWQYLAGPQASVISGSCVWP